MENILICICGPTASGKTALSVALAKERHTEIISADSMQLYRRMDIGTAKPTMAERQGVPHHLFDVAEPGESFSVARYVELADAAAQDILRRGMIPIVCGGTGLYLDALIECAAFSGNETDRDTRACLQKMAAEQGNEAVHRLLAQVDPERAAALHPNNVKRVIRALEVYKQTGMTLSELNERNRRQSPKYRALKIGLCPSSREILYERIDRRVDKMVEDGLLDEAAALYQSGALSATAAQAIGYKELRPYFEQTDTLESCLARIRQKSRNYAKRQLTWLKRDPDIHWIYYDAAADFSDVLQRSTNFLTQNGI